MTDTNFPLTTAKMKAKYEHKGNKTDTVDAGSPSTDKYVSEKGLVDYVDELKDYVKGS